MFGFGVAFPLEVFAYGVEINFAFFSRHASRVRLELFAHPDDATAARVFELNLAGHRTGDVWHVWVEGIPSGQYSAHRVDGPYEPNEGHRFNSNKLLLDPFARAISLLPTRVFSSARVYDASVSDGDAVCSTVDHAGPMPRSVFPQQHFHWHEDRPVKHPWLATVIYETQVRAFTIHPSSQAENPGMYRRLTKKFSTLKTCMAAVDLMPVGELNERQPISSNPQTGRPWL